MKMKDSSVFASAGSVSLEGENRACQDARRWCKDALRRMFRAVCFMQHISYHMPCVVRFASYIFAICSVLYDLHHMFSAKSFTPYVLCQMFHAVKKSSWTSLVLRLIQEDMFFVMYAGGCLQKAVRRICTVFASTGIWGFCPERFICAAWYIYDHKIMICLFCLTIF